jgi:N-hydroxyarylamine O-acetyltransferase
MLDLDAYLARIGLRGRPSVPEVHRAHATSIPFENLDPHRGVPVSIELEDLERKLVTERRGGYCFEHNLLLKAALEALGAQVDVFLARVRWAAAPGEVRGRSHVVLRVRDPGHDASG